MMGYLVNTTGSLSLLPTWSLTRFSFDGSKSMGYLNSVMRVRFPLRFSAQRIEWCNGNTPRLRESA